MGFVERVFQAAYDRLHSREEIAAPESAIAFGPLAERLSYVAASISSLKILLQDAPDGDRQGWGLHGKSLFLPRLIKVFPTKEQNYEVLTFRLIIELLTIEYSRNGGALPKIYHVSAARMGHLKAALDEAPYETFVMAVAERLGAIAQTPGPLSGHAQSMLVFSAPAAADVQQLVLASRPGAPEDLPDEGDGQTAQQRKKTSKHVRYVELKEEEMNPLVHTFEKIHTLDDYTGGNKQIDDADELKAHARALEDLDLDAVVRTDRSGAGSIEGLISPNAEFESQQPGTAIPKTFRYGEWDGKQRRYQPDWCQVREYQPQPAAGVGTVRVEQTTVESSQELAHHRAKGKVLEQRLAYFLNSYRWKRRQPWADQG